MAVQASPLSASGTLSSPRTGALYPPNSSSPLSPTSIQALVTSTLLSVSVNLTTLGTSYKWDHMGGLHGPLPTLAPDGLLALRRTGLLDPEPELAAGSRAETRLQKRKILESKRWGQRRVLPGPRPLAVSAEGAEFGAPGSTNVETPVLMARVLGPEGPSAPLLAAGRGRFRRAAGILAHVCGLTLLMKRYIEKSRAEEWARFYLSIKNHSANELLFDMSNFSKYSLSKDFAKLKTLMFIQPKQRSQENLREIQLCLKKNRSFHSLPNEVQLQLCQTAIYQELEAESMLLRQGHVPLECYLILAGHLKVMSSSTNMNKNTNSEILSEFEEGDFIGEICLLTNTNRPASILCKTDVKLLVISKDDFYCTLAQRIQERYQETHSFLRSLPLFFSWPKEKIDFLVHCSLRRYYRAGPTIVSDNFNSHFLVFIISGRCRIIAQMNCEEISVHSCVTKTSSSTLKNPHAVLPPRGPLDVTGRSLETATVSPRTSFSAARKKTLDTKKPPLQGDAALCFWDHITWAYCISLTF
ncbi:uncharacterized protein LOC123815622 [Phyllostomus hastatus]|uniref:uncharacterized protein LOC123815622 n=1 Tax=Phyllostomus hastatus TaxID=9423 RepID=UPI001E67E4F0|nr:uncharacterized protein LOC123815622 [Phyllostomus hastatus]